jgi:hypothetical protein
LHAGAFRWSRGGGWPASGFDTITVPNYDRARNCRGAESE